MEMSRAGVAGTAGHNPSILAGIRRRRLRSDSRGARCSRSRSMLARTSAASRNRAVLSVSRVVRMYPIQSDTGTASRAGATVTPKYSKYDSSQRS